MIGVGELLAFNATPVEDRCKRQPVQIVLGVGVRVTRQRTISKTARRIVTFTFEYALLLRSQRVRQMNHLLWRTSGKGGDCVVVRTLSPEHPPVVTVT